VGSYTTPQFDRAVNWRYQETVLSLAVFANFSQLWTRLRISPLVPAVLVAFDVSKSFVGLALTGMWAAYALFQYPSGVFGSLGSVVTGSLADTAGWPVAYGFVVLLLTAGVVLVLGRRVVPIALGNGG